MIQANGSYGWFDLAIYTAASGWVSQGERKRKKNWCWDSMIKQCFLFDPMDKKNFPMVGNNSPFPY